MRKNPGTKLSADVRVLLENGNDVTFVFAPDGDGFTIDAEEALGLMVFLAEHAKELVGF